MAKFAFAAIVAAAGMLCGSGAFAGGPFGTINVGDWHGGAYTKGSTTEFTHCAALTTDGGGTGLVLGQSVEGIWLAAFSGSAWNLQKGESVAIQISFDGQKPFNLFGMATSSKTISAILSSAALAQFVKARQLAVTEKSQTVQFALSSTAKLVAVVANCVARMKTAGVAKAGDFSNLPERSAVEVAAAPSSSAPSSKLIPVSGTGFVISTKGHVVTNNHVVRDCVGEVHGNLVGEGAANLRIVSTDETNDLALLEATKRSRAYKNPAVIRRTAVHSGDSVIAIGYPFHGLLTSDFTVTTGIVSSLSGLLNDTRFLQISAPVQPGNSGGPLLDTSGNVVGVVSEKLNALKVARATGDMPENINFAIKTGALQDFLDNSAVAYETAEPADEMKTADIATAARAYTMLISCTADVSAPGRK